MSAPFPKEGITLAGIRAFIDECGGREVLVGLTTTNVNELFQLPSTLAQQCSYCNKLQADGRRSTHVRTATVFISHAWGNIFLNVVDALECHFRDEPNAVLWFDLFSSNLHIFHPFLEYDWLCHTYKSAIGAIGRTVMVLSPWPHPVTLTRASCLWELICTSLTASVFEVAISHADRDSFISDICSDCQGVVNGMLSNINIKDMEANRLQDLAIFQEAMSSLQSDSLSQIVPNLMCSWMIDTINTELFLQLDESRYLQMQSALGLLHCLQGNFGLAEPLFAEALRLRQTKLGDKNPETMTSMSNLAKLYHAQGRYESAEALYEETLRMRQSTLGDDHPDTLTSLNNLAELYLDRGRYELAEPLFLEALHVRQMKLGDDHPDTMASMNNLAGLYRAQGRLDLAEALHEETLRVRRMKLLSAALDRGKTEWGRSKIMIVGQGRAGKTALANSIIGTAFKDTESTIGINQLSCDVKQVAVNSSDELVGKWVECDKPANELQAALTRMFHSRQQPRVLIPTPPVGASAVVSSSASAITLHHDEASTPLPQAVSECDNSDLLAASEAAPLSRSDSYPMPISRGITIPEDMVIQCLAENISISSQSKMIVSIYDFGGQPIFDVILSLFLTRFGVYVLVFNMEWLVVEDEAKKQSCLDYLKFWLNSVVVHTLNDRHLSY